MGDSLDAFHAGYMPAIRLRPTDIPHTVAKSVGRKTGDILWTITPATSIRSSSRAYSRSQHIASGDTCKQSRSGSKNAYHQSFCHEKAEDVTILRSNSLHSAYLLCPFHY